MYLNYDLLYKALEEDRLKLIDQIYPSIPYI